MNQIVNLHVESDYSFHPANHAPADRHAGSDQDLLKETWAGGQALMPSLGGNIAAWDAQALGGIRPDPAGPGFKKTLIKPSIVGGLHWVVSHYDSVHGRIVSHWRKRDGLDDDRRPAIGGWSFRS